MKFSKRHLAIIAIIANNIIWGASPPIFKWSLVGMGPFTLAYLRFLIAAVTIFPLIYDKIQIKPRDIGKLILLTFFGIFLNITFFYKGLTLAPSINASIIFPISPLFLIIASLIFLHEKFNRRLITGGIFSLIGIGIIVIRPLLEQAPSYTLSGNIDFLLSILSLSFYMFLIKKFKMKYPSLTIVFWEFLIASVMFFPFFLNEIQHTTTGLLNIHSAIGILYGAFASSVVAYSCLVFGEKYIKASEVGIFMYLNPVFTVIVAIPLLHEQITPSYITGAIFIFIGLLISEGKLYHPPFHLFAEHLDENKHQA